MFDPSNPNQGINVPVFDGEGYSVQLLRASDLSAGERSVVGSYLNHVRNYFRSGRDDRVTEYSGMNVAGWDLITDPDVLMGMASDGFFDFDDLYEEIV